MNKNSETRRSLSLSELYSKAPAPVLHTSRYGYSTKHASPLNTPPTEHTRVPVLNPPHPVYGHNPKIVTPGHSARNMHNRPLPAAPAGNKSGNSAKARNSRASPSESEEDDDEDDDDDYNAGRKHLSPPNRGDKPSHESHQVKHIQNQHPQPRKREEEMATFRKPPGQNNNLQLFNNNKLKFSRHSTPPTPIESLTKYDLQVKASKKAEHVKKPMRSLSLSNLTQASPKSPSRSKSQLSSHRSPSSIPSRSSGEATETKDVILRKVYKTGKWMEQREEITLTKKPDGSISKRSKFSESALDNNDEPNAEDAMSKLDKQTSEHNLEQERSSQLFSRHGRGLIQDDQDEFSKEILSKMNSFRVEHSVKSLKVNEKLSQKARDWAKYLSYSGQIRLSNRHDAGESIFVKILPRAYAKVSADDIVEKWYSEGKDHAYEKGANLTAANFTQMIWRSTREIGTAVERSVDGKIAYVVVYYYPKGNIPSEHVKQVPPVGGFASKDRNEKGFIRPHVAEKDEGFADAALRAMNYYRLHHRANPLTLDKSLTEYAQEWANQLATEDRIRSRPKNIYGENIYRSTNQTSTSISGQEPVEYWYKKKAFYNFSEPEDIREDMRAAPFAQLVWQATHDVGIGIAKSKTNYEYVVANFNPPGNRLGQFEKQVSPMKWQ